ncbi:MAG TPA: membrane protein insertase YidC [Opitutaceae bacterium]|nr:membrane protein insertase YidC [Opitutaceae bacterium]
MDKKNLTIGVFLLIAAFASIYFLPKTTPPAPPAPELVKTPAGAAATAATATATPDAAFAALVKEDTAAGITTLANDFIEVRFTDFGGAIRDVALVARDPAKKNQPGVHYIYSAEKDRPDVPFVFNQLHAEPMLAFVDLPGLDRRTRYQKVSATANEVVYRAVFADRIEVTRRYVLAPNEVGTTDPYQLRAETTFRNLTAGNETLPHALLNLGTAAPLTVRDFSLATGRNADGHVQFIQRTSLQGGGFLSNFGIGSREPLPSIESPGPLKWTSVSNQFFASIYTPDQPANGLITRRIELPPISDTLVPAIGITGAARFDLPVLPPQGTATLAGNLYVGPKEYHRLANIEVFKADQDAVMQFGFFLFRYCSQLLLTLMTWIHSFVPNWGVAIILTTLTLKIVTLPLTLKAARSMKRMQKFQPEIQALREKYKDNPQKMQTAMMDLYREHKVNPMGGCLPMLIPLPFFWGFFRMLQSAAELRFAEFLWAKDLSASDTVLTIYGFPLNILPLILGATMLIQTRLVPQPATMDNTQAKVMKFMPLIFMAVCYFYSCALSLYSTVNGLFTILQQLFINRMPDTDPAPAAATGPGGKPVKNVTPGRRK